MTLLVCSSLSFSPLAGIRYVETYVCSRNKRSFENVSVPLRGLDMWKRQVKEVVVEIASGFSPLAGIRYVETNLTINPPNLILRFSPLAGIDMWKPDSGFKC